MADEAPFIVSCPARLSPYPDAPDYMIMPCVLPYGHIQPRMHLTADDEPFTFESGINATRDPEPSPAPSPTSDEVTQENE